MSDDGPTGPDLQPAVAVVCMIAGALDVLSRAAQPGGGWFVQVEPQVDEAGRWTNVLGFRCELGNFSITVEPLERPSVTCPECGATSWNPTDVAEGYCGRCHDWTSDAIGELRHVLDEIAGDAAP